MTFKKISGKLHLWLGLGSGIIIVFLGITGCLLAFEQEIRSITDREQYVKPENKPFLPPSVLRESAEKKLDGKKINGLEYSGKDKAVISYYYDSANYFVVAVNPYTASVNGVKDMNRDFFRIVLNGHYYLFLPPQIGQPIVASATLIFVVLLITGLVLWWPRNKAARKQRFKIKWNAKWKRLNYDLHNVLGFYMTWVAIIIAITGLVWGFEWVARSIYWTTSGGKTLPEHVHPVSDTSRIFTASNDPTDKVWEKHFKTLKEDESISVYFAREKTDPIEVIVNHRPGTYYNTQAYMYDQYTGDPLEEHTADSKQFSELGLADKISKMNYDLHVGAILGLPGKIMAFFASLIAASLPVTGFYVWWGRRKKQKNKPTVKVSLVKTELAY